LKNELAAERYSGTRWQVEIVKWHDRERHKVILPKSAGD
jgi:hypothetical protein